MGEGAVIMALAMADAGAVAVGEDDRHQHHVRRQRFSGRGRLQYAPGAGFAGRAFAPEEDGVAMLEPGQAVTLSGTEPGDDVQGADLVLQRVVGGYAILQPRVTPSLPVGREGS